MQHPLILFTNDDGINSPGLWASVRAFKGIGDRLVVAPREQQSATGRSLPFASEGRIYPHANPNGDDWVAYAVDGSPAQAVQHGILEIADRLPSLIVSGINYGENTGNGVTISGTVGAAIEGASFNVPAIAVSQQTPHDLHLTYSDGVNFDTAAHFTRLFGQWLLSCKDSLIDIDVLKIDVPWQATIETDWRITRLSRHRVYWPTRPERTSFDGVGRLGYRFGIDPADAEPDSDVYAVLHEKVVSVTPMSLDMTSRLDLAELHEVTKKHLLQNS